MGRGRRRRVQSVCVVEGPLVVRERFGSYDGPGERPVRVLSVVPPPALSEVEVDPRQRSDHCVFSWRGPAVHPFQNELPGHNQVFHDRDSVDVWNQLASYVVFDHIGTGFGEST